MLGNCEKTIWNYTVDKEACDIEIRCDLCNVDYDVIGNMDTFSNDLAYVFHLAGIANMLPLDTVMNSVPHSEDRAAKYFDTLNKERLKKLHDLYRYDFELFGFDAHLY